jgi:N-acetylneuraminic acid mutarotase
MASAGGNLILYGGVPPSTNGSEQTLADTWEFDGKLWTQVQDIGPGPLEGAQMTFDSGRSRIVLFGGLADTGVSGSTWEAPVAKGTSG